MTSAPFPPAPVKRVKPWTAMTLQERKLWYELRDKLYCGKWKKVAK